MEGVQHRAFLRQLTELSLASACRPVLGSARFTVQGVNVAGLFRSQSVSRAVRRVSPSAVAAVSAAYRRRSEETGNRTPKQNTKRKSSTSSPEPGKPGTLEASILESSNPALLKSRILDSWDPAILEF